MMGSPGNEWGRAYDENGKNGKQVRVEIRNTFEMMSHEVTQALYKKVMGKNPSFFKRWNQCDNWDSVKRMCPDNPVEQVSWNDVQEFIKKLNASVGLKGCEGTPKDPIGCYRLPTEAEWEYAVRAGTETDYFFYNPAKLLNYAIYGNNSKLRTRKVKGNRLANPYGLYDVYGNVWEWVQDGWQDYLEGGKNPLIISNEFLYVIRGGSYLSNFSFLRSANRGRMSRDDRDSRVGFRLVRNI